MKKRLGCLHSHYSNIEYIENALSKYDIELIHFVDPGLMYRVTSNEPFSNSDAQNKVKEQIEWIAQCNVDAILITCTTYIAIMQDEAISLTVPIIKIDEPYFKFISKIQQPQTIVFTNPATVQGTMCRLKNFAATQNISLDVEVKVIENSFNWLMLGQTEKYAHTIAVFLHQLMKESSRVISVAQLSMVEAAERVEDETSRKVINPLDTLVSAIVKQLNLEEQR